LDVSRRHAGFPLGAVLLGAVLLAGCGARAQAGARSAAGGLAALRARSVPDGDWRTFDYNAQRSGVGPRSTGITRANLRSLRVRTVQLPGVADSSAIQLHGVQVRGKRLDVDIVTTTYGRTIAFSPFSGRRLWEYALKDINRYQGSAQITTASPVADPGRRYVYAASPDGFIHKLSIANGHPVWSARITWDARREKIAPALNVSGRYVLVATGGYDGDQPVYEGHVVAVDRASGHIAHVWNAECSNRHHLLHPPSSCRADTTFGGAAIWARSGVVVEPGSRRLLIATGNGPFNGRTNWGDSVLELSPDASRLEHNWTPKNQAQLNANDLDLGSTGPALLPGTDLAVQGGKAGKLALLDLKRLDGTTRAAGPHTGGQLQTLPTPGSAMLFSAPSAFRHGKDAYVVVADGSATAAYKLSRRRLHRVWEQPTAGTSPVIAGGLLFVYDELAGELRVMAPVSGRILATRPAAAGHWSSPIVVGGRIILPVGGSPSDNARTGKVLIYHLPGR
jgi:hypothetical protein